MPKNHKINRSHKPDDKTQAVFHRSARIESGTNGRCPGSPSGGHWWCIGATQGVSNLGICKFCGEKKEFWNTVDAYLSAPKKPQREGG